MGNHTDVVESEKISDSFICCVCLDLIYKPIVLACGHASCFWCVHRSMSGLHESHCPVCRHPYGHFPTICQMLHFLLLKMYPVAYKARENHILEEEKTMGCFSPKVDDVLCAAHTKEDPNHRDGQAQSITNNNGENSSTNLSSTRDKEIRTKLEQPELVEFVPHNSPTIPKQITAESFKATCTVDVKENNFLQRSCSKISGHVSVVDVSCASCKQLLFRPAVLNCGHVYCEACIVLAGEAIRCQVCQSPHPNSFPKVCLEFDHFVEEQFPEEYAARRGTVQRKQVQFQNENPPTSSAKQEGFFYWLSSQHPDVHVGAGCDSCGLYPIVGDRYRCIDCKEAIGFDLCGDCYSTRSKLPGRFNQQHTPDHRFEKEESNTLRNITLRLLRGDSVDGFPANFSSAFEDHTPNEISLPTASDNTEEPQNDETQPTL